MAELADVYAITRKELANFVSGLPEEDLERPVPATPEWTIRDVIAHLTGVLECSIAGDFPREFFMAIGSPEAVERLNEWTNRHVGERRDVPLQDLLDRWDGATSAITPMIRGDEPWPDETMSFAGYVLTTDLGVHQQDIYGALGIVKDRDSDPIRIGFSVYATGVDLRIKSSDAPSLRLMTEHKEVIAGDGEPEATVRAPRFELFRALSGRRNLDQVRAYDWDGDPEPFLEVFYPYGVREDALVE